VSELKQIIHCWLSKIYDNSRLAASATTVTASAAVSMVPVVSADAAAVNVRNAINIGVCELWNLERALDH
jgi:hypothetical protein